MYCSSCGSAVPENLAYCNRCGAIVRGTKTDGNRTTELPPESLLWAIVAVFIIGLGAVVGLTALMKDSNGLDPIILAIAMSSFALMVIVEAVFIRLLLKRTRGGKVTTPALLGEPEVKELGAAQARSLAQPLSSVTEHTTRSFEPIYTEKNDPRRNPVAR